MSNSQRQGRFVNGKWFYFYLVSNPDRPNTSLSECEPELWDNPLSLIVAWDPPEYTQIRKLFTAFPSAVEFLGWFARLNDQDCCFYEVIRQGPQKMRFDVDIDLTKQQNAGITQEAADLFCRQVIRATIFAFAKYQVALDATKDICLYSSHRSHKFSYHIVINGYLLRSSKHCEVIYNDVIEMLKVETGFDDDYIRVIVDNSIYKSLQQFRLPFNMKRGSRAPKILQEQWKLFEDPSLPLITHVYPERFETSTEKWLSMMRESLVGLCDDIYKIVEVPLPVVNESPRLNTNAPVILEDALDKLISQSFPSVFNWSIANNNKSIIVLRRKVQGQPYLCPVCKRTHENENPFLIILGPHQAVYYRCRRTTETKIKERTACLGYLNPDGASASNDMINPDGIQDENNDEGTTYINPDETSHEVPTDYFVRDVSMGDNDPSVFTMFGDNGMRTIAPPAPLAPPTPPTPLAPPAPPILNSSNVIIPQPGFNRNVLEVITEMARVSLTKEDERAAKKQIPEGLIMNRPVPTTSQDDKYVSLTFVDRGAYMIDSHLGTGKTSCIIRTIYEKNPERVFVLTPRRIYARSICGEINRYLKEKGVKDKDLFVCYMDIEDKTFDINKTPRVVIQMESLWKLNPYFNSFMEAPHEHASVCNMLICDESESLLKQFSSYTTMKEHLADCAMIFQWLVSSSQLVICSDAFLQERTKQVMSMMLPRFPHIHRNYRMPARRKAYPVEDLKTFFSLIMHKVVNEKKKVVVCCSSKAQLNALKAIMNNVVEGRYYDGDCDESLRRKLSDVRAEWRDENIRIVAYTSVITVGVNFDEEGIFDCLFVYGSAPSCTVRDLFQGTMRVRHLNDKEMYYTLFTKPIGKHDEWSRSMWMSRIALDLERSQDDVVKFLRKIGVKGNSNGLETHWLRLCHIYNIQEINVSKFAYQQVFEFYEICTSPGVDIPIIPIVKTEIPSYHAIPLLTHSQANTIFNNIRNGMANEYNQIVIEKYNFSVMFDPAVTEEVRAEIWDKFYKDKFTILKHIHAEKNLTEKQWQEKQYPSLMMYYNRPSLHAYTEVKKINDLLGISNSCPERYSDAKNIKLRDDVFAVFNGYKSGDWYRLRQIFGYRTTAKNNVAYFNVRQIYKTWSGTNVCTSKKRQTTRGVSRNIVMLSMHPYRFGPDQKNIWDLIRTDRDYVTRNTQPAQSSTPTEPPVPPPRTSSLPKNGPLIQVPSFARTFTQPPPRPTLSDLSRPRTAAPVINRVVEKPAAKPVEKQAAKPVEKQAAKPVEKPISEVKLVGKVVPLPVKKPLVKVTAPKLQE